MGSFLTTSHEFKYFYNMLSLGSIPSFINWEHSMPCKIFDSKTLQELQKDKFV